MKIVILTGAGISAESGIATFRDANGLWEGDDIMEVASPEGFAKNPKLVLDFYNQRRKQLLTVNPNKAHTELVKLENDHKVSIITQNVDDLHERAGSTKVIHLHGELLKARSTKNETNIVDWDKDITIGDFCSLGHQLRPHIVWFGEAVPKFEEAIKEIQQAEMVMIIGTSMQVYPAASLIDYAPKNVSIYFIDPKPNITSSARENLTVVAKNAVIGVAEVVQKILRNN